MIFSETMDNYKYSALTELIIRGFYTVYNTLGYGFLEKVYERALQHELVKAGLQVERQYPLRVTYDGENVGFYLADLIVEHKVIIELKSAEQLHKRHEAQLVNYLRATDIEVGLLLNFGPEPQVKRRVLSADYKKK